MSGKQSKLEKLLAKGLIYSFEIVYHTKDIPHKIPTGEQSLMLHFRAIPGRGKADKQEMLQAIIELFDCIE